jgi:hypothetical protein
VRGISIKTEKGKAAPKLIKIVTNKPNIGFGDVEDAEEHQVSQIFELDEETVTTGKRIPLRFVKFQSVQSIHVTYFQNSLKSGSSSCTRFLSLQTRVTKRRRE